MKLVGRGVSSCLLTLVLMLSVVANQMSSATLTGRVVDPNGAAIFGAKVDATNIDTNITYSTETHADGLFVIGNLAPGRYRIFVRQQGFQTIVKPEVELHVQDVLVARIVGAVAMVVVVLQRDADERGNRVRQLLGQTFRILGLRRAGDCKKRRGREQGTARRNSRA